MKELGKKKSFRSSLKILNPEEVIADAKLQPVRKRLVGSFIRSGINTLFFSRTNVGKSIFGFEIAYHISKGISLNNSNTFKNESKPKKVLFYDAELNSQMMYERYPEALKQIDNEYFMYVSEKETGKILMGKDLINELSKIAEEFNAEFIIVDNISKILPDSLDAKQSAEIINLLKLSRERTGADWFVIGHTKKTNPKECIKPIDYHGSSMIQNFFLEIFYLDETNDGRFLLRHAKCKHADAHIDSVPILNRKMIDGYGLGFEFEEMEEYEKVKKPDFITQDLNKKNIKEYEKEIRILFSKKIGATRISELMGCSRNTIYRIVNNSKQGDS